MQLVLLVVVVAALIWWAVLAQRMTLWPAAAAFMALGYVLGPPLLSSHIGPIPLTVDRLLLVVVLAALAWHWRLGRAKLSVLTGYDWLLVATLVYFTIRCAVTARPDFGGTTVGPWWRLVTAFWIPALIYLIARAAPPTERAWIKMLWVVAALGVFLALTGYAEVFKQWWAVFPRYIANPALGTHFGRARGPALNSVSLGIMLTTCFWAAWFLWPRVTRAQQLALAGALVVIAGGVYFTYTRSTWIGLAAGLAVVPLVQLSRRWRVAATLGVLVLGSVGVVAFGHRLTDLGRKDSDESAEHSVYQRASFTYVSARMFADAPIFGCGFGRFYDKKIPYLTNRSQQVELESIRDLDHHNTLLSVLVETGIVGFALFVGLLTAWGRAAWRLMRDAGAEPWWRAHGLFAVAVLLNYLSSALFHDLTLAATEAWMLFFTAGISVGLLAHARVPQMANAAASHDRRRFPRYGSEPRGALALPASASESAPAFDFAIVKPLTPPVVMTTPPVVQLFGMKIDSLTMGQTVDAVLSWCRGSRGTACRYVVTPNVDHAVMFQSNEQLRSAYAGAALVLADGAPVVVASRLLGRALPERVAGSDLAPALFKRVATEPHGHAEPLRVFLLGAGPGVAERAAANIEARWPGVNVVGTLSPPMGFDRRPEENDRILEAIAAVQPDLLLVGLGAPKQELWVHAQADRIEAKAALCIGATIDFLAGEKRRAPRWMRRLGLEWLHRLSTEPKRLAKRYLRDAWIFPQLVWRDWRGC